MKTTKKLQRINQFVYIHYENAKSDGHLITLLDSYRNKHGKIYQIKNDETGKYIYAFKDMNGNEICKAETIDELKAEIATRKSVMLEQAHQRRIQLKAEKTMAQNSPFNQKEKSGQMEKDAETFIEKTVNESRDVMKTVHEFAGGEDERMEEMQQLRQKKQQRSRGISR